MKKKIAVISILLISIIIGGFCIFFSQKSEDEFEAVYQEFSDEDVMYEDGELFVDSQLLITASESTPKRKIQGLVKSYGGEIVGYLSVSNDYQVSFPDKKTLEELNSMIEEIQKNDFIETVSLHKVVAVSSESGVFLNDPWINADKQDDTSGTEWTVDRSEGNNWWAEAIKMPYVWGMNNVNFSTVKVGIIDSMFDIDNEDLDKGIFTQIWNNPVDDLGNCTVTGLYLEALRNNDNDREKIDSKYYHGTHVAGIIAAEAGNGFGIAGVSRNSELYGYADETEAAGNYTDIFGWKYAMALMFHDGVKVVNISKAMEELSVAAQKGVASAEADLESYSNSLESFFRKYIRKGYDFLIVKSAGNLNGKGWVSDEINEEHIYGYRQVNSQDGIFDSFDSTEYDAQYDVLGAIEDEEIRNHILIVGAAENHKTYYEISDFSTTGERVDVYAPGTSILSDMPDNITASISGTSMSAPIVTGIASLIWGINPELTSEQVHNIIITSVDWIGYKKGIPIVNAYAAVLLAQNTIADESEEAMQGGTLFGVIYSKDDENERIEVVDNAVIRIYTEEGELAEEITPDLMVRNEQGYGSYFSVLSSGKYTVTAEAEGYVTQSVSVDLQDSEVIEEDFVMVSTKTIIKIIDADTGKLISDAQCTISRSDGNGDVIRQNTDENGKLEQELNSGTYQITISKDGYNDITQEFQVNAHENTDLGTLEMKNSQIDLMNYIGTDILAFANAEGDFKIVGTSSGGIELSNESLIISESELKINFISIDEGTRYTYGDLKIGMDWDDAEWWLINRFWNVEDSYGSYFKLYNTRRAGTMGIHLDENNCISSIWYSSGLGNPDDNTVGVIEKDAAYTYLKEHYGIDTNGITIDELVQTGVEGAYFETVIRKDGEIIYNISLNALCSCVTEEDVSTGKCRNYIIE